MSVQGLRILKDGKWNKPPVLAAARLLFADALNLLFESQPLGDLADFLNGTSYDTGLLSEVGVPIIRISNITNPASSYIRSSQEFPDRYSVSKGDLLVSWSASFKSITWPGPHGILNQHIFKVTEAADCNRTYVKHIIEAVFDEMQKNVVGMGMMHLRRGDFLGHKVPKPPLPVQESIAMYLDWIENGCVGKEPSILPELTEQRRIVEKIESLATKIEEAKRLRQAIQEDMNALLIAMAHRNDLSEAQKTNQGWRKVELGEVLTQTSDPVPVMSGTEYPHFGIFSFARGLFKKPVLSGTDIKATRIYRIHSGQFIYARLNAYEGAFGLVSHEFDEHYVSNEFPAFDCQQELLLPEFLISYFRSPKIWEELKRRVTGIGGGAGNRRIRLKESVLLSLEVWLPPINWQQKIKITNSKLEAAKNDSNLSNTELDAFLPSILDKAFRGDL